MVKSVHSIHKKHILASYTEYQLLYIRVFGGEQSSSDVICCWSSKKKLRPKCLRRDKKFTHHKPWKCCKKRVQISIESTEMASKIQWKNLDEIRVEMAKKWETIAKQNMA